MCSNHSNRHQLYLNALLFSINTLSITVILQYIRFVELIYQINLPGHKLLWHFSTSTLLELVTVQLYPPYNGAGLSQLRCLLRVVSPQDPVHWSQGPQEPHPPFTTSLVANVTIYYS